MNNFLHAHLPVIVGIDFTFSHPQTWHRTRQTVIGCFTGQSDVLLGSPWPM